MRHNQKRYGYTLYLALTGSSSIVLDNGGNEDETIAALLHDAVEDRGGQSIYEEIRHCFGDKVAELVAGCTDAWTIPKPPWRQRKEAYLRHIGEASPSVLLVALADSWPIQG